MLRFGIFNKGPVKIASKYSMYGVSLIYVFILQVTETDQVFVCCIQRKTMKKSYVYVSQFCIATYLASLQCLIFGSGDWGVQQPQTNIFSLAQHKLGPLLGKIYLIISPSVFQLLDFQLSNFQHSLLSNFQRSDFQHRPSS